MLYRRIFPVFQKSFIDRMYIFFIVKTHMYNSENYLKNIFSI